MAGLSQSLGAAPQHLSSTANQVTATEPLDNEDGSPPAPQDVTKPETYQEKDLLSQQATVHDIRGTEDQYTLDTTGFQICKHESVEKDFLNDDHIKGAYYSETEELLKKVTGASKIFIFDHTVRRAPITVVAKKVLRGPVKRVHVDQSYSAARDRVTHHLPSESSTLLKGRFQIINAWRPIKKIRKDPFGVISAHSVDEDELVPIRLIYPNREGGTFSVRPPKESRTDGGHQWRYLSEQAPNEVLLVKCFDSKTDGRARRVPHSAFVDEKFVGAETRESIEVRALVFHPDDTN